MPEKKLVAIEDNSSSVVIKAPSEVRAHKWFMTLSQYCFVAPTMEGEVEKKQKSKINALTCFGGAHTSLLN